MGYRHTKSDILDAAVTVTVNQGIGALTFANVGAQLEMSDRMVVYYFPSKDELIAAVAQSIAERIQSILDTTIHAPLPAKEFERRAWQIFSDPAHHQYIRVFFELIALASTRTEPYASLGTHLMTSWCDWTASRITTGTATERYAQALAVVATIDGLLLLHHVGGPDLSHQAAITLGLTDEAAPPPITLPGPLR